MNNAELRQRRLALGLTQKQLGELLGYDENHIYMLESGRRAIERGRLIDLALTAIELNKKLQNAKKTIDLSEKGE